MQFLISFFKSYVIVHFILNVFFLFCKRIVSGLIFHASDKGNNPLSGLSPKNCRTKAIDPDPVNLDNASSQAVPSCMNEILQF